MEGENNIDYRYQRDKVREVIKEIDINTIV
jgi:hypothetical protein